MYTRVSEDFSLRAPAPTLARSLRSRAGCARKCGWPCTTVIALRLSSRAGRANMHYICAYSLRPASVSSSFIWLSSQSPPAHPTKRGDTCRLSGHDMSARFVRFPLATPRRSLASVLALRSTLYGCHRGQGARICTIYAHIHCALHRFHHRSLGYHRKPHPPNQPNARIHVGGHWGGRAGVLVLHTAGLRAP